MRFPFASLFSAAGLGDFGFVQGGLRPLLLTDVDPRRTQMLRLNFPTSSIVTGDIIECEEAISQQILTSLPARRKLFMLAATPPCQGMSKNGIGTILKAKRDGQRPTVDERNTLYRPFLRIVQSVLPEWVFFENVCRMMTTYDVMDDRPHSIPNIMEESLHKLGYSGQFKLVQLANYGLPQTRLRTVGLFRLTPTCAGEAVDYLPPETHAKRPKRTVSPWRTVRDAIGNLPALDATLGKNSDPEFHPLHRVPPWRDELYHWLQHTPEGASAFSNNRCIGCGELSDASAVSCGMCGEPLPKPTVEKSGERSLISGFPSAYKRMVWDKPAPTVTTRSAYACSDNKVHPEQNRVLSSYEVAVIQGVPVEEIRWGPLHVGRRSVATAADYLVRDFIGECVPSSFARQVAEHLIGITQGGSSRKAAVHCRA